MEIARISTTDALKEVRDKTSQLRTLVLSGYDLSDQERADPIRAASKEYDYPDERAVVFVAKEGEEAIGSLTLILWKDSDQDKRGSKFWPKLRERVSVRPGEITCDVGGIVVNPIHRGKSIGRLLYQKALTELDPAVIVGQTKTAGAVMLRSKLEGYRTTYGETEVTDKTSQSAKPTNFKPFLDAYLFARDIEKLLEEGIVYVYKGGIASTLPNVVGYPTRIQEAFGPVIRAQGRLGDSATVMAPLISVREDLLI